MPDPFAAFATGLTSPGRRHFAITPVNGVDLATRPRVIKALTAGNVIFRDEGGVIITYPVVAGEVIDFSPVGVEATNGGNTTTATVVGWY